MSNWHGMKNGTQRRLADVHVTNSASLAISNSESTSAKNEMIYLVYATAEQNAAFA
jgi:hypothetical protein